MNSARRDRKAVLPRGHAGQPLSHADRVGQFGALKLGQSRAWDRTDPSATARRTGTGRSPAWPGGEIAGSRRPRPPVRAGSAARRRADRDRAARPGPRAQAQRRAGPKKCRRVRSMLELGQQGPRSVLLGDRLVQIEDQLRPWPYRPPARPGRAADRRGDSPYASRRSAAPGSPAERASWSRSRRPGSPAPRAAAAAPWPARNAVASRASAARSRLRINPLGQACARPRRNVTSFSSVRACSGVLVRDSRTMQVSRSRRVEGHHRRRRDRPLPERVQAAAVQARPVVLHVIAHVGQLSSTDPPADTASPTARRSARPAARRGPAPGRGSSPPAAGAAARAPAAGSRDRARAARSCTRDDCRYVGAGDDQSQQSPSCPSPIATNSTASQSSSSGWLGGSPCAPKSSTRLHQPGAEEHLPVAVHRHPRRQRIGRSDQPASQPQPVGTALSVPGADERRHARRDLAPGWSYWPRSSTWVARGNGHLLHHHRRRDLLENACQLVSLRRASSRPAAPDRSRGLGRESSWRIFRAWPGVRALAGSPGSRRSSRCGQDRDRLRTSAPSRSHRSSMRAVKPAAGSAAGAEPQRLPWSQND